MLRRVSRRRLSCLHSIPERRLLTNSSLQCPWSHLVAVGDLTAGYGVLAVKNFVESKSAAVQLEQGSECYCRRRRLQILLK